MKQLLLTICFLWAPVLWSSEHLIEVLELSKSKKSLLIDKGLHHNIIKDDFAVLLKKISVFNEKLGKDQIIYKPVMKIKVVKVFNETSYWIAVKEYDHKIITKNSKFTLITQSELLAKRRNLTILNRKLITNDNPKDELKQSLIEDGQELSKKRNNYYELKTLHNKDKHYNKDIELIDVFQLDKSTSKINYNHTSFYKSPHADEFSRKKKMDTFDKMLVTYLRKINDPTFSYNEFYKDQRRIKNISEFKANLIEEDTKLNEFLSKSTNKETIEQVYNDIVLKGKGWSESYSDEELSQVLTDVSALMERERRLDVKGQNYDYQMFFSAALPLIDNQLLTNADNIQQTKFDFSLELESYFFSNIRPLRRFTLTTSLRLSQNGLSSGDFNAKFLEYTGSLGVNWYLFRDPYLVDKNIFYIGFLARYGQASLVVDSELEQSIYQVFSFPALLTGVKYNFYNSWGVRIQMSYEKINLSRLENVTGGNSLNETESYADIKLMASISKFF